MNPIIKVEALVCGQEKNGTIFEQHGVMPYRWFIFPDEPNRQMDFQTIFGEFTIKIEVTKKHE